MATCLAYGWVQKRNQVFANMLVPSVASIVPIGKRRTVRIGPVHSKGGGGLPYCHPRVILWIGFVGAPGSGELCNQSFWIGAASERSLHMSPVALRLTYRP